MNATTAKSRIRLLLVFFAMSTLQAQVSFDRLLRSDDEPHNWLTYSGTNFGQRHSKLAQITPDNVSRLELQWVYQVTTREPSSTKFEATPLVLDGVMYTVQPPNDVLALDAATGRALWTKPYTPAATARPCCGRVNRGVAILGDTLFMGTIDGHLLALDAKDGRTLWDVALGEAGSRLCDHTRAAHCEEHGDRRAGWRRVWDPGIPRGVRCENRQRTLAVLHCAGSWRAWLRLMERRVVEDWRGFDLDDRFV